MDEIGIGALGVAVIAGLISLLGLIIGKEQKISEFRHVWIDDLRKCMIDYLVYINAISDIIRARPEQDETRQKELAECYKSLNTASDGIFFRVNENEESSKSLIKSMELFEKIASENRKLTPENIKRIEKHFRKSAKSLLKLEWERVKKGEKIYTITKNIVLTSIILSIFSIIYLFYTDKNEIYIDYKHNLYIKSLIEL